MLISTQATNHSVSKERLLPPLPSGYVASPLQEQLLQKQMPLKHNQRPRCQTRWWAHPQENAGRGAPELPPLGSTAEHAHFFHLIHTQVVGLATLLLTEL